MKTTLLILISLLVFPSDAALLFRRADSLYNAGKLDAAMAAARDAAEQASASSDTTSLIKALCIQADIAIDRGEDMDAVDYYNRCADLIPFGEPMFMLSSSLFNIANIYFKNGAYDKADEYIIKSINVDKRRREDSILALRYLLAAEISYAKGEYSRSLDYVEDGIGCLAKRRSRNILGRLMFIRAKCHEALGGPDPDWAAMEDEYRNAYDTMTTRSPGVFFGEVNPYAPELLYRLGKAVDAQGKDASACFREAIVNSRISQTMHGINPVIEIECINALADICTRSGDMDGAQKYREMAEVRSFVPYVNAMSNKLSLSQMEFIRREKDKEIEQQRERAIYLVLIAAILALASAGLLLLNRRKVIQKRQIEEKNAQLVKLVLQKDQLIEMLKESSPSASGTEGLEAIEGDKVPLPDIKLSKRETEVLELCCKGMTNKEIAANLNVSVRTVESHKLNICSKVGVNSTPELIAFAFKSGLIR